jgi:phosphoglycolate phosphatase
MKTKGIIFDLDGTLVDSLDDLTVSMNFGLESLGFPTHTPEAFRQMVGYGVKEFGARALGSEQMDKLDTLIVTMRKHYADNCLNRTRPYPGVCEIVDVLQSQNIRLAVLTNKNQDATEKIVRHFFGPAAFEPVIGHVDARKTKPDPEGVHAIVNHWRLSLDEVILVGDSESDAQTAAAAGIRFIGCEWGFRSREVLLEAGAKVLIQQPRQILDRLDG